jgi:hypothetical protein
MQTPITFRCLIYEVKFQIFEIKCLKLLTVEFLKSKELLII